MSRDLIGFPVDLLKPSPPAEHTHASKYTVYNLCNRETAHSLQSTEDLRPCVDKHMLTGVQMQTGCV